MRSYLLNMYQQCWAYREARQRFRRSLLLRVPFENVEGIVNQQLVVSIDLGTAWSSECAGRGTLEISRWTSYRRTRYPNYRGQDTPNARA